MAVQQQALTVVGEIRDEALSGLPAVLENAAHDVLNALEAKVPTLHFGRFVIVGSAAGDDQTGEKRPARLVLESNFDGELAPHLNELAAALAPFEDAIFGAWKGYEKGKLAEFVAAHSLPARTFYLGHPGLTAVQIKKDRALRIALEDLLDRLPTARRSAQQVRSDLLAALAATNQEYSLGHIDRGLPNEKVALARFIVGTVVPFAAAAAALVGYSRIAETEEQKAEKPELIDEDADILKRINAKEDASAQNGLTHYVALRPGKYRKTVVSLVLWFLEQARRDIAYQGQLGGIESIHFARWVFLPDDSLLFFSNYDGSWESYLGDFVDKAHSYLSLVWSSTRWFPKTEFVIFGGASKESSFKQWTRTCQLENQIWYSAYRDLTVGEVLKNATLREGAVGDMSEADAQTWLEML